MLCLMSEQLMFIPCGNMTLTVCRVWTELRGSGVHPEQSGTPEESIAARVSESMASRIL